MSIKTLGSFVLVAVPLLLPQLAQAQTPFILDDFENHVVGQPPGFPQEGSRLDFGAGVLTVVDTLGSQRLQSVDNHPDSGFAHQWVASSSSQSFVLTYDFRIESSTTTSNSPIADQDLRGNTAGSTTAVVLQWLGNGDVDVTTAGLSTTVATWTPQTTYSVRLGLDCSSDTFDVSVNGTMFYSGQSLGADCLTFHSARHASYFEAIVTTTIDDVTVAPETPPLFADGFESGDLTAWGGPPSPPGDSCATAPSIMAGGTLIGDLAQYGASTVSDSCGTGNTIDAWYTYVAPCTGTTEVTTCHPGTTFDSILSVWDNCPATNEVACNDDDVMAPPECGLAGLNRKSTAVYAVTAGSTYYFRVSAFGNPPGNPSNFELSVTCTP
ncbi:MAG: hypothetical protein K8J08_16715 [Thermoanaerobaculia bacterium]|nr:hypothetical protein [Thermoanaerobaculia bacterium]